MLAISGSECGHEKRQQLPAFCSGSDLQDCIQDFAMSPTSICSGDCRDTLEQYVDECLSGVAAEQYLDTLDLVCRNIDEAFCNKTTDPQSDLATCIANYASSPDSVCSGDCRDTLERYGDVCLTEEYLDELDQACDDGSDATTATATASLASTVTALVVALATAFN